MTVGVKTADLPDATRGRVARAARGDADGSALRCEKPRSCPDCPSIVPELSLFYVGNRPLPSFGSSGKSLSLRVWSTGCDDGSTWSGASNPVGDATSPKQRSELQVPHAQVAPELSLFSVYSSFISGF